MTVIEMVAIVFTLNQFSILWGEKSYFIRAVSHKPQLQSLQQEMAQYHLIRSYCARRGLWLNERGCRHEPDDFYLAIGNLYTH